MKAFSLLKINNTIWVNSFSFTTTFYISITLWTIPHHDQLLLLLTLLLSERSMRYCLWVWHGLGMVHDLFPHELYENFWLLLIKSSKEFKLIKLFLEQMVNTWYCLLVNCTSEMLDRKTATRLISAAPSIDSLEKRDCQLLRDDLSSPVSQSLCSALYS